MNKKRSEKIIPYLVLTVLAIVFILPLLWVLFASLDVTASQALKIPRSFTLGNYREVLSNQANRRGFAIGLMISLVQSAFVVILAGLAAYPLSRYELRYRKMFLYTILFMTSLPMTAVMVPVFKLFLSIRLYDSITGVILFLTATSLPYGIWLMKSFMDGVPVELEEAAKVDGASTFTGIRKVIIPLMFPGICVTAIFTFSGSWGNFFVPYILLQTLKKFPASVKLYQFFGNFGMVAYGQLAAYSALYAMPSILLYIFAQNYMSKGFNLAGAAKG
ncbi:carbohydrate ABC transporter permease [Anaerocolumna sp. AGMB13025]|uniref:carbohydrate ABC transporter permease n=1 Tax=Anaerocolumna sp. AGMB13025 TaxID=3039116 RepID=UPI00241DADFE|nr:carbohydrate ABC transporter permease [Anaerocolumna sp. AGMB13025]WFR56616.1 carbohydrate ABC transporter permease [Anaerocolumna sp. AGMB13025]